jgi:hypothetical protein
MSIIDFLTGKFAKVRCGASVYGFSCSLEKGHDGNHKAFNGDNLNGELIKEAMPFAPPSRSPDW